MPASSTDVRKADPAARRRAVVLWIAGVAIGAVLIAAQDWYREPVRTWLLDDPERTAMRGRLLLAGAGALLILPLFGFGLYMWRLAARVMTHREFPPPGQAVIRDTPILRGDDAFRHGRGMRAIAIFMFAAGAGLAFTLWRFASLIGN